jgi:Helix-turn-helix domain
VSHAANFYVKKLKTGVKGEPLTVSERAVLWYLADGHNEENGGTAWPSLATLAEHCGGLSVRSIRRLVSSLETKGVLQRLVRTRKNGSYQSSLYYFPALGYDEALLKACGKVEGKAVKPVQKGVKKTPPTLTPVTGYPDATVRETMTPVTGSTLTPVSSLETVIKHSLDETPEGIPSPPLPPKGGESDDCDSTFIGNAFVSGATAKTEALPRFASVGTPHSSQTKRIGDEEVRLDPGVVMGPEFAELVMGQREADCPFQLGDADCGLVFATAPMGHPCSKQFDGPTGYVAHGNSERFGGRPRRVEDPPVPNPVTGSNWIAPPLTPKGHWEAFKCELLRRLEKLPDRLKAEAVDVYRTGIEPTYLIEEELDEGGVEAVWTIASHDPERTQGTLTLLRNNVLAALLVTAKIKVQLRVFGAGGGEV